MNGQYLTVEFPASLGFSILIQLQAPTSVSATVQYNSYSSYVISQSANKATFLISYLKNIQITSEPPSTNQDRTSTIYDQSIKKMTIMPA